MKILLYSLFIFFGVPLVSFSLEPNNPVDICDRFLNEKKKSDCMKKVSSDNDWYALNLCEKIQDDEKFMTCIETTYKAEFDPRLLGSCEQLSDSSDDNRLKCISLVKNRSWGTCKSGSDLSSLESCLKTTRLPASR